MGTLLQDIRYSARLLLKRPGFTAVAILTLALGIGANTAIFSMVNSVLLRPLSYRDPQRLCLIREVIPQLSKFYPSIPANAPSFLIWQRDCKSFDQIAIVEARSMAFTGTGDPKEVPGAQGSANLFNVLGVQPALGRLFYPEEDQPGRDHVVILSSSFWYNEFHGDPRIIGKTIALDAVPYEIVGVLPPSFHFPKEEGLGTLTRFGAKTEFFKPLGIDTTHMGLVGDFDYAAIARLKPGVTQEEALAELNVVQAQIAKQSGQNVDLLANLVPLETQVVGPARRGLLLLLAAVGAVMLIVCVNLVNLLLARVPGRMREAAVRMALGATRARLVRQMLTETLLLSLGGGLLGVALAYNGLRWLMDVAPLGLQRLDEVQLDGRVLWFAFFLSVGTGALFGILPAWRMARADAQHALNANGGRMTEGRGPARMRQGLISLEVGLSTVLLILAGLLTTSLVRLLGVEKGFGTEHVLTAGVDLSSANYASPQDKIHFYDRVLAGAAAIPGVSAAGLVSELPLEGERHVSPVWAADAAKPSPAELPIVNYRFISQGYFEAMGIPLRRGRALQENDRDRDVAVVSASLAERLWPGQNPIGRQIYTTAGTHPTHEVVGVVGDIRTVRLDAAPVLMVYIPQWERPVAKAALVVRTTADPRAAVAAVREVIRKVDSSVPSVQVRPMAEVVSESVAARRFQLQLAGLFAGCALLLAALGIYGVVAYSVEQRRNEIGIRMALGAQARDVGKLVLDGGMRPVVIGLAIGIVAAVATAQLVRSLLFSVSATDPVTIAGVGIVIVFAAAMACYIPARRAMKVDPIVALRYE
ncbi:MAG: ABC transporter permease [Candidatus Acidiferrales bacterium]